MSIALSGGVPVGREHSAWQSRDWLALLSVVALAALMRWLFFTGFFGSDEVTYIDTARKIASGDWTASGYIGATRYGMNLPVALSIGLFGLSEFSANLWPYLCSLGEVVLVFLIVNALFGLRAAVLGSLLLALLPLHVHLAGRIMADPPLGFFLTLSVGLILFARSNGRWWSYLLAGLAWGGVFWVKEVVAVLYLPVFLAILLFVDRRWQGVMWALAGAALAVAANCALMWMVAGDPMHLVSVLRRSLGRFATKTPETSPWFYFKYLFLDIRHTLALGFLVAAGLFCFLRSAAARADARAQFLVVWVLLMVGMFSFAIVSFSPIKLVSKQTNYMVIFFAPLAALSGWYLASLKDRILMPLLLAIGAGSFVLAALEQQAITAFTANSRAAYEFLRDKPNALLFGSTNNYRAVLYRSMMEGRSDVAGRAFDLGQANDAVLDRELKVPANVEAWKRYAVLDLENIHWGSDPGPIRRLADVPPCWQADGALTPADKGRGEVVVAALKGIGEMLPGAIAGPYSRALKPVSGPATAHVFQVSPDCLAGIVGVRPLT